MANFLARKWESDLYIASNKKCLECIVDSLKAALQMRIPCNGFQIHWKVELMVTDWLTDYHSCVTYAKTVTSVEDVVKIVAIFMIEVSNWRSIFFISEVKRAFLKENLFQQRRNALRCVIAYPDCHATGNEEQVNFRMKSLNKMRLRSNQVKYLYGRTYCKVFKFLDFYEFTRLSNSAMVTECIWEQFLRIYI